MKSPDNAPLHISLAQARSSLSVAPRNFIELFKYEDCSVELYSPTGKDSQHPHAQDELYIISSGSGMFRCEDRVLSFVTGDVLFVPAHAQHRFESFTEDFATWVVFFGSHKEKIQPGAIPQN